MREAKAEVSPFEFHLLILPASSPPSLPPIQRLAEVDARMTLI